MLWFVPVIVAAFFIVKDIFWGWMAPEDFIDGLMGAIMAVFLIALVAGVCLGGAALTGLMFASHAVEVSDVSLVAIRDKDGIQGQFFLGSGMIKSDQYYFYYQHMPDGGFRPGKVFAGDGVRVYEEDRKDARLKTFTWVTDSQLASLIAIPVNAGGYSYDFYVPKGTIRTGFTM